MSAVFLERARQGKFPQPVPHHVFSDKHREERFAVMHIESVPYKVGRDRRSTRPGLDRLFRVRGVELENFIKQMIVNERAFFNGSSHNSIHYRDFIGRPSRRTTINWLEYFFFLRVL